MKKENHTLLIVGAVMLLAVSTFILVINKYNPSITTSLGLSTPSEATVIADSSKDITSQPEGYGVKRPITEDPEVATKSQLGNIDIENLEHEGIVIKGKLAEDEKVINSLIQKEDDKITSSINWTDYRKVSVDDYKALIVASGTLYEKELNKSSRNRYSVEASIPDSSTTEEIGIEILFDVDEDGYFILWANVITKDLQEKTEIEEIKKFILYYKDNELVLK